MNLCACGQLFDDRQSMMDHCLQDAGAHEPKEFISKSYDLLAPYRNSKITTALSMLGMARKPARGLCHDCGELILGSDAAVIECTGIAMHVSCALALGAVALSVLVEKLFGDES